MILETKSKRADYNKTILKKHLIVCEGLDEQNFLISYLNSDALANITQFSDDIQVMNFGGNSELSKHLQLLQNADNFEIVESLMIVRDAETDAGRAIQEIKQALQKASFSVPEVPCVWEGMNPKIGYLIFPTLNSEPANGTLEDMCLSILSDADAPTIIQEIDKFMEYLADNQRMRFSHPFKTKLHTYFSLHSKYVSF